MQLGRHADHHPVTARRDGARRHDGVGEIGRTVGAQRVRGAHRPGHHQGNGPRQQKIEQETGLFERVGTLRQHEGLTGLLRVTGDDVGGQGADIGEAERVAA